MTLTRLALVVVAAFVAVAASAAAAPNDQYYPLQWGLDQVRAPAAWATSSGAGQVVAVVDTGVDLGHPDLQGKLVAGATFTGCASSANGCGNGDWRSAPSAGPFSPHGTHVAGIAAAVTGNGIGVAGTAPDAQIMPVKVLTDDGGTFEEIAAGIRWSADHGADVINLSLGALPGVQALPIVGQLDDAKRAIDYAVGKGVVVVAAAGNDFASICGEPAFNANAMCVVSTDRSELRSAFSNFAVSQGMNVVAAPGGAAVLSCQDDVISTVPGGTESSCSGGRAGYDFYAGTSMATPHVAGVSALLTAQGRSPAQIYAVLKQTARTPGTGSRGTYTSTYGYGIVDAAAAVAAP